MPFLFLFYFYFYFFKMPFLELEELHVIIPTPVFLPGESQGQGSLVGCCLWDHTESDTTEAT